MNRKFDFVLIDCTAGIDDGFELAMAGADQAVVVTTPQVAAVHDADCVLRILKKRDDLKVSLLVNSFQRQMAKEGNMLRVEDIKSLLDADLLGVVYEDAQIIIAQNHGESVIGKKTSSDQCYRNICRRLLGEEVPLLNEKKETRLFSKFIWSKKENGRVPV